METTSKARGLAGVAEFDAADCARQRGTAATSASKAAFWIDLWIADASLTPRILQCPAREPC